MTVYNFAIVVIKLHYEHYYDLTLKHTLKLIYKVMHNCRVVLKLLLFGYIKKWRIMRQVVFHSLFHCNYKSEWMSENCIFAKSLFLPC